MDIDSLNKVAKAINKAEKKCGFYTTMSYLEGHIRGMQRRAELKRIIEEKEFIKNMIGALTYDESRD